MKLVGRVAEWVAKGAGPRMVDRVIVETDRVKDIGVEVAQMIREAISPLPLLRSILPRFTGPTGLPIAGIGVRDILMRAGDILSTFMTVKIIDRFNLVSFPATPNIIETLESDRRIRKIYPDRVMWALEYPTVPPQGTYKDKLTGKLFTSTEWTRKLIGADKANQQGFMGQGIKVAVIDTAAAPQHRAISHAIGRTTIRGIYTDENGHGHWCAACIGGKPYVDPFYNIPTQGIAPDCQLFTIKSLGFVIGFGNESDILEAMDLAARLGCKIVSMSLGSEEVPENPEDDPQVKAIETLTKENNMIFCVAAGNSGPNPRTINSPGIAESAITVGAYDPITGDIAPFSSRGPTPDGRIKPDIIMPGVNILAPVTGILDGLSPPKGAVRDSALSGTCLVGDTIIYTPEGPVELKDLEIGDYVYSFDTNSNRLKIGQVVDILDQGIKEVYELETHDGRTIIATENHPILVNIGWGHLKWLTVKELMNTNKKIGIILPFIEPKPEPTLDEIITVEIAKTLGYFLADGWLSRSRNNYVICSAMDGDLSALGIKVKVNEGKWKYAYSKRLALALSLLGFGQKHNVARIPKWCYHLSQDKIRAFINGFCEGDGSLSVADLRYSGKHNYKIEIASKELCEDLKILADWAGYGTGAVRERVRYNKPPNSKSPKNWKSYTLYINRHPRGKLFEMTGIKKISFIGKEKVFDLTVLPYSNFLANRIVVHNSMATPHASGLIALMCQHAAQHGIDLSADDVKAVVKFYGEERAKSAASGWGMLTWDKWLEYARHHLGI